MRRMYSVTQLSELIHGLIADGLLEDVDVQVKTIEQKYANWSLDLSALTLYAPEGFSASNLFCRMQKVNQELEIIFTFSITNNGDSSATPSNIQCENITLPAEIGKCIIDLKGDDLTKSGSLIGIAGAPLVQYPDTPSNSVVFNAPKGIMSLSHNGENKMFIAMYDLDTIGAGATHTYSGRIQLTLI